MKGGVSLAAVNDAAARAPFDVASVRQHFPLLQRSVRGKPLIYLDNAATTQKPSRVIDALRSYYCEYNANVHRAIHALGERATASYEAARESVRRFINAREAREIVFVRGTTEAVNLIAQSFLRPRIGVGEQIVITQMEHHSNIVPWQLVAEQTGARLRAAPINERGELVEEDFLELLTPSTRLVAITHLSNALGTINPVGDLVAAAHARHIPILIDGAQAVPHMAVDVQALGCDFYAFSGHKVFGPTGIGVLYGRADLLETMPPYQGGGEMIEHVSLQRSTFAQLPHRFEAGTPNIAGAIGLAAALEYLRDLGMGAVAAYERSLREYATEAIAGVPGLRLVGTAAHKAGILSFVLEGAHASDVGTLLDLQGIAIRAGHHCAMPALERLGAPATARASLAMYNTREEVDALVKGLHRVREMCA